MVQSKLNTEIYLESVATKENDIGHRSNIYETLIFGFPHLVALGKISESIKNKNYYQVAIYLVSDSKIVAQIGVHEIYSEDNSMLTDSDERVLIGLLKNEPLYYRTTQTIVQDYNI